MQKKILSLGINGNVEVVGFFDDGKTIDLICPDEDGDCPSIFPTGSIDDGKPENFTKLVKCNVILGMTRGKAIQKAAAELPKSHSAWVEHQKPGVYAQV